jgi:hypothetical protein
VGEKLVLRTGGNEVSPSASSSPGRLSCGRSAQGCLGFRACQDFWSPGFIVLYVGLVSSSWARVSCSAQCIGLPLRVRSGGTPCFSTALYGNCVSMPVGLCESPPRPPPFEASVVWPRGAFGLSGAPFPLTNRAATTLSGQIPEECSQHNSGCLISLLQPSLLSRSPSKRRGAGARENPRQQATIAEVALSVTIMRSYTQPSLDVFLFMIPSRGNRTGCSSSTTWIIVGVVVGQSRNSLGSW